MIQLFVAPPESEQFWQLMLQRDFGFGVDSKEDPEFWKQTLRVEPLSPNNVSSLFGVDFWQHPDPVVIVTVESAFLSWQRWTKASARFLRSHPSGDFGPMSPPLRRDVSTHRPRRNGLILRAPYFLRAARFWQRLSRWCHGEELMCESIPPPAAAATTSESLCSTMLFFRNALRDTFSKSRGLSHSDWSGPFQNHPGMDACHALFSFSRGQMYEPDRRQQFSGRGLVGGYEAYGYSSNVALLFFSAVGSPSPQSTLPPHVVVAFDLRYADMGLWKEFRVDAETGALDCFVNRSHGLAGKAVNIPGRVRREDDLLVWLEEHMRRLEAGEVRVQETESSEPEITLYPQFPRFSEPRVTNGGVSVVSRAVTRGVEAIGSAVYVPQARNRFGFVYSIRLRLLQPGEIGYQSPTERGFTTCQLASRHWRITNDATGRTEQVDGEGVIGMYPILFNEGGFALHNRGPRTECIFKYQSCSGPMTHGQFGGYLRFVPGTLDHPTGPQFDVILNPFSLLSEPEFLY